MSSSTTKYKSNKKKSSSHGKVHSVPSKTIVLISPELNTNDVADTRQNLQIIKLKHPRQQSAQFVYNVDRGTIHELLQHTKSYRSWFIGNSVSSNENVLISTPIDPLFLILPYFIKNNKYRPFEELIHDELFEDSAKLECLVDAQQLSQIAIRKDYGDIVVWNYCEKNTLQWLKKKIDRLTQILKLKRINVADTSCAVSNTFAQTMRFSDDQYSLYAHGIISEYLDDSLCDRLLHHLNLADVKASSKRKANDDIHREEVKRLRQECRVRDIEKAIASKESKSEKSVKKNLKQAAALAKAATGTKNISDFFKKK